jgi:hypothetical protein
MATSDHEFDQARRFSAEDYEPPRQRGCFFYGCIIASVLALLLVIIVGVVGYAFYKWLNGVVQEYTATAPRELPKVEMPAEQRATVMERFETFRKAVDAGTPTEPLVLTGDDINALIEETPQLKGKIYVTIEGERLKGQLSIPLDALGQAFGLGMLRGRYLNGEAELKASLQDGVLIVTLASFEVNGKRPPEELLSRLRQQNMAQDAYKDPKNAEQIRKLESLEIKDGKLIVKARRSPGTAAGGPATPEDLPEDVMAPPEAGRPKAAAPAAQGEATPRSP